MKIIQASIDDIGTASKLFDEYRVFYNNKPDLKGAADFLTQRIQNKESVIYLAIDNSGNGMGFVQLYPVFSSTKMKRLWLLNDLYVNRNYRKKGVGEALINKAKELTAETGARGLILETANDNFPAQKLYIKTGWIKDEEHFYYTWEC